MTSRRLGLRRRLRGLANQAGEQIRARVSGARLDPGPHAVGFESDGQQHLTEGDGGETLLEIARRAGVDLSHYCGGGCSCGTCRVVVVDGADRLTPVLGPEAMVLGDRHVRRGDRLACQARVLGPVSVQVPRHF